MNRRTKGPILPAKWLVVIVVSLISYGLLQPLANRKFGWRLPSLAQLLGNEQAKSEEDLIVPSQQTVPGSEQAPTPEQTSSNSADVSFERQQSDKPAKIPDPQLAQPAPQPAPNSSSKQESANTRSSNSTSKAQAKPVDKPSAVQDDSLLYGLLRESRRGEYVSPAGLRYTRGSEEGHRLEHLKRHLQDQPDRPGRHGVFDGDMEQVLRWLDEAYTRAKAGGKGTQKLEEEGRSVYEVSFSKPLGYIGGRDGKRLKHPDTKRLRMVVDEDRLITAFPF